MEKKITDYLHFYLGQECKWRVLSDSDEEWTKSNVDLKMLDVLYDRQPFEIKPILRPLSNMTQEEFRDTELSSHPKFWTALPTDEYHMKLSSVVYMLKKGFDLFGLIESGLAIDKTTLTK